MFTLKLDLNFSIDKQILFYIKTLKSGKRDNIYTITKDKKLFKWKPFTKGKKLTKFSFIEVYSCGYVFFSTLMLEFVYLNPIITALEILIKKQTL